MSDLDSMVLKRLERIREMPQSQRRRALLKTIFAAALAPWNLPSAGAASREVLFTDYPFKLGVASGFPSESGMTLWTRLCPDPMNDGGMGVMQVPMDWEVASDEAFSNVVQRGTWYAMAGLGHSAHVPVTGLEPDRWYFYRFIAGGETSPVGRTRTLPSPGAAMSQLRFGLASCQHFEMGYFSAYRHMQADAPDLVLFVGDYIYEYNAAAGRVRRHAHAEPYSLAEYRARYAQYGVDSDLQTMRQSAPWAMTVDDHEVMNDWADDVGEGLDPSFVARRAAGLQAYFENMPLPMSALLKNGRLALNRSLQAGSLAGFHILDDRQYRSPIACSRPGMGGSVFAAKDQDCPERLDAKRTMLGAVQEDWLDRQLAQSRTRWNFVVQQTLLSPLPSPGTDGPVWSTDGWDGYPAARERLLKTLQKRRPDNPVILGGDIHATVASDVKADFSNPDSRIIASEFAGTSLTSPGMPASVFNPKLEANPHVHYGDCERRGYLLFDLKPDGLDVAVRNTSTIAKRDSDCLTAARFHVEANAPGIRRA